MFKNRVFERATREGLTDAQLAARMQVSASQVCRVKSGELRITASFIRGALRAFPDARFEDLFTSVDEVKA